MGFSISHLLVVLAIIAVAFGTKRLRNIGTDLGGAIKDFQAAIKDGDEDIHVTERESQTVKPKMSTETENS